MRQNWTRKKKSTHTEECECRHAQIGDERQHCKQYWPITSARRNVNNNINAPTTELPGILRQKGHQGRLSKQGAQAADSCFCRASGAGPKSCSGPATSPPKPRGCSIPLTSRGPVLSNGGSARGWGSNLQPVLQADGGILSLRCVRRGHVKLSRGPTNYVLLLLNSLVLCDLLGQGRNIPMKIYE